MQRLIVSRQDRPLQGAITVPGDKSISHRAALLAAVAQGTSRIRNWLPAGDTLATLGIIQDLGIDVAVLRKSESSWDLTIEGAGLLGLRAPEGALNCVNAGTCMRLLGGILAGQNFRSTLDGSEQLRKRPMNRIIDPLHQMGARISSDGGRAPLIFEPARLRGIQYEMPISSAQVKSAVLLAGLWAEGSTAVFQPAASRDHTERMLSAMGASLTVDGPWIRLSMAGAEPHGSVGALALQPLDMDVPGDFSSAAFPLIAAAVIPRSRITISGLGLNPTRTGLLDALTAMAVPYQTSQLEETGGEPAGAISLQSSGPVANDIEGPLVVRAIDELPIWAVAATQAEGISHLRDAAELRVKEVDRIGLLAQELAKMGAHVDERVDGLDISGPTPLEGAEVSSHGDHRLAMALVTAGLAATGTTVVHGAECIADSFPGYVDTMRELGAGITAE